jgi:hypothetical protein
LDQVDSLQWISDRELRFEIFEAGSQGVRTRRTTAPRPRTLQSNKVPAHSISLPAAFSKCIFVRGGETWFGWLLSWWHTTSIAYIDSCTQIRVSRASQRGLIGLDT